MNTFNLAYHTDVGIKKRTNQDSLLINGLSIDTGECVLLVLCDGMGGMEKGELASATVVRAYSEWFKTIYVRKPNKWDTEQIKREWMDLLVDCNKKLQLYGSNENVQLGTTATALLINATGEYLIGHVGDSRVYKICEQLKQLTEDHTFVAKEITKGTMTKEQAQKDTRRNVLLQCVGVNDYLSPQFLQGVVRSGEAFLVCSDGFRHEVSEVELLEYLDPEKLSNDNDIKQILIQLTEMNKQRNETDNISAIYIKRL